MAELSVMGIVSVVIAAFGGTIVGAFLNYLFTTRLQIRQTRNEIVHSYIVQLQDAVESLLYRLNNISNLSGRQVMDKEYFLVSTLYALGPLLAVKQSYTMNGIHSKAETISTKLGNSIKEKLEVIDDKLNDLNYEISPLHSFFRYDRQLLGESILSGQGERLELKSFLDFRNEYENPASTLKEFLSPGIELISSLKKGDWNPVLDELQAISNELALVTGINSGIQNVETK